LSAGATNVVSAGGRDPASVDSSGSLALPTIAGPVSFTSLGLLGEQINADNMLFKQLCARSNLVVNPSVTGTSNYFFDVKVESHKIVPLTRAYHKWFEKPPIYTPIPPLTNLQVVFNDGSKILAKDDDTRIPDSDPSVAFSTNASSLYRSDDVPAYVEFRISDSTLQTNDYTPRRPAPTFPTNFASKAYYAILAKEKASDLLSWGGANIKQVKSMEWANKTYHGWACTSCKPANMVLVYNASASVAVHEWTHNCGSRHRNEVIDGVLYNPGPGNNALMASNLYLIGSGMINRYEHGLIQSF
jgi:hypothetical protein